MEKYSVLVGVFKTRKQYLKTNKVARIIAVDQEYMGKLQHAVKSKTVKKMLGLSISDHPKRMNLVESFFKRT